MGIISGCKPKTTSLHLLLLASLIVLSGCLAEPSPSSNGPGVAPEQAAAGPDVPVVAQAALQVSPAPSNDHVSPPPATAASAAPVQAPATPVPTAVATPVVMANQEVASWPRQRVQLTPGKQYNGALEQGDGVLNDDTLFDVYEFDGTPNAFVTLTLESQAFDPFLVLVEPDDRVLASNDDRDSKLGPAAQLRLGLGEAGTYQVWVNSSAGRTGSYTLSMETEDHSGSGRLIAVGDHVDGWLAPGDQRDENGLYVDTWTIAMPAEAAVVWLKSNEFDTLLRARKPDGAVLIDNDDVSFVANDGNSRVVVAPSDDAPAGTEIRLEVALPGDSAVGGRYDLQVFPLFSTYPAPATLKLQPVIVAGSELSRQQVAAALADANTIWNACNINVELADNAAIETTKIDGIDDQLRVGEHTWTAQETLLQTHPSHVPYEQRVVTAYFVKSIDGGERFGIAYPSTRYPAQRSGLVAIADAANGSAGLLGVTLAHELGHILGLEHASAAGDGDPQNDTATNLMNELAVGGATSALQCLTARSDPHYLHHAASEPLTPPAFQRSERVLLPGDAADDALTTQSVRLPDGPYVEAFYFSGKQGQQVTVELSSSDFDAVVWIEAPNEERIAEDDDTGAGTNASITITLPMDGDYSIGVSSYQPAVGAYHLEVAAAP